MASNAHLCICSDEDVLGFQIAMDHTALVKQPQPPRDVERRHFRTKSQIHAVTSRNVKRQDIIHGLEIAVLGWPEIVT